MLNKHLLLSMLKTVLLINIFIEAMIVFFQDSLINRKFKRTACIWNGNIVYKVFTDMYDQFNAYLLKKYKFIYLF